MMIPDKRDALGGIPERFDALLAGALTQEEEKPMKRKLSTTILVTALLIVLLAATALAVVSISRSAEGDAIHAARQALGEKYGLTTETLGLFMMTADKDDGGGWTVVFEELPGEDRRKGTYTVAIGRDGVAEAAWTHDGVDPALWQGGDMDAPVWGQAQMMAHLEANDAHWREYGEIDWENADFATVAKYRTRTMIPLADGEMESYNYAVPEAGEIAPEAALETAKRVIREAYGVETDALVADAGYNEVVSFVTAETDGARQFMVEYVQWHPIEDQGHYTVRMDAASGEVLGVSWYVLPGLRTLPEGPLDGYRHAAEEYMASGALEEASAARKADAVARIRAAGWEDLLADVPAYVAQGAGDIAEDAAIEAARLALADAYGLDAAAMGLFEAVTSLTEEKETGRVWTVSFAARWLEDWYLDMDREKLGGYVATVDAATGDALAAAWDAQERLDGKEYARAEMADAPVWGAREIPWLLGLMEEIGEIAARYPGEEATIYDYAEADIAAYDAAFRAVGYPRAQFPHGMPRDGDVTREAALETAKAALLAEMEVPEGLWEEILVSLEYVEHEVGMPQWHCGFQFTHEGVFVDFGVAIDARTGEVLYTNSISGGVG